MGWISRDYLCTSSKCKNSKADNSWEDMVQRSEELDQVCPLCGSPAKIAIVATNIATYSMMSKDDQAKHLRKRSRDHTRAMLKKDPTTAKMSRHIKMGNKKR